LLVTTIGDAPSRAIRGGGVSRDDGPSRDDATPRFLLTDTRRDILGPAVDDRSRLAVR
jgi:hypothetical protein